MRAFLPLLILICMFEWLVFAQQSQFYVQKAEQALKRGDLYSTIILLEHYLKIESEDDVAIMLLADAYRLVHNCQKAKKLYLHLWNKSFTKFSIAGYWAAKMLQCTEFYAEAKEIFLKLIEMGSEEIDKQIILPLLKEVQACDSALYHKSLNKFNITIQDLKQINTHWSEFNPGLIGDTLLYFSSLRALMTPQSKFISLGDVKANIYRSNIFQGYGSDKVEFFAPELIDKKYHITNISFSSDGNKAFFNRCKYNYLHSECEICVAERQGNRWSKISRLPDVINLKGYSNTQPFFVYDSVAKVEVLYFSSNRPGGFGGMDLWFSIYKNQEFQKPVNLGSIINTPGNEISPFYDLRTKRFYYSTDGFPGMGGFDIYYSSGSLSEWKKPVNMWYPVNSGANDINFFAISSTEALFASNRPSETHINDDFCCYDIYYILFQSTPAEQQQTPFVADDISSITMQKDIAELLPLALYFDNDHPDPRSLSSLTNQAYDETYFAYINRKDVFVAEYTKGLQGFDYYYSQVEMEDFFDNYVLRGYQKLLILTNLLYQDLLNGNNVTLRVRGYTSPLTSTDYNMLLARRRVQSLINFFKRWENGTLIPFMEDNSEVRFQIIEEPIGEVLTNEYVSDNPYDRRMSVYSKAASIERRIEIEMYEADRSKYINIQKERPILKIDDNLVNLRQFVGQSDVTFQIHLENIGDVPLNIDRIITSNPMIIIKSYKEIINPNQFGQIIVNIKSPINQSFTEYITLFTNTSERRHVVYFTTLTTQ